MTKNLKIKFNRNYDKLHNQTSAILKSVEQIPTGKLTDDFIKYDTACNCETFPEMIPGGSCLILTFVGDKKIPFSTCRNYTGPSQIAKENQIDKTFDIVIVEDKPTHKQESLEL